jgi:hypothetical protein
VALYPSHRADRLRASTLIDRRCDALHTFAASKLVWYKPVNAVGGLPLVAGRTSRSRGRVHRVSVLFSTSRSTAL